MHWVRVATQAVQSASMPQCPEAHSLSFMHWQTPATGGSANGSAPVQWLVTQSLSAMHSYSPPACALRMQAE
jgi:hypothetical protein